MSVGSVPRAIKPRAIFTMRDGGGSHEVIHCLCGRQFTPRWIIRKRVKKENFFFLRREFNFEIGGRGEGDGRF